MKYGKIICLITTAAIMMTGCGSTSAPASTASASTAAASAEKASEATEAASTAEGATEAASAAAASDEAVKVLSDRPSAMIKICRGKVFAASKTSVLMASASDLSDSSAVYTTDNENTQILSMAADDASGYVFLLVRGNNTIPGDGGNMYTTMQLVTIGSDGKVAGTQDMVDPNNVTYIECIGGKVYEFGIIYDTDDGAAESTKKLLHSTYEIESDGTLKDVSADDKYDAMYTSFPDGYSPVQQGSYFGFAYYSIPYCMEKYGCIYATSDGQPNSLYRIKVADDGSLSKPESVFDDDSQSLLALTADYALTSKYVEADSTMEYYCVSLSDGTSSKFAELDMSDSSANPMELDYDDAGMYVELVNDADGEYVPAVSKYPFKAESSSVSYDTYAITEKARYSAGEGCFENSNMVSASDGIYYVIKDADGSDYLGCMKGTDELKAETPVYDSGYGKAGITLKSDEKKYLYDNDTNKVYYEVSRTYPVFGAAGSTTQDAADKMNSTISDAAGFDESQTKSAEDYYKEAQGTDETDLFPYTYTVNTDGIKFISDGYICIGLDGYDYEGGAHGMPWSRYYTFDRKTGEQLKLTDVVENSSDEIKSIVETDLGNAMNGQGADAFFTTAKDALAYYKSADDLNWYLTKDGIAVEFGEYEIASYAAGPQTLVIPYSEFKMKIDT